MEKREKLTMDSYFQTHQKYKHKLSVIITTVLVIVPFVKVGDYHLFLFNFYDERFEFFFQAWEVSFINLTVLFVMSAVWVILILNFTYSRYFCGHLCPKTLLKNFFTNIIEIKLFKNAKSFNLNNENRIEKHPFKTTLSYFVLFIFIFFATIPFIFYLIPYDKFYILFQDGFNSNRFIFLFWIISSIYLFLEMLFFKEFFCSYICPYQMVSSIMINDKKSFYKFSYQNECLECDACIKVCPIPKLDIKQGFDVRCISCGDCSAVCHDMISKENKDKNLLPYADFTGQKNNKRYFSLFPKSKTILLLLFVTVLWIGGFYYITDQDHITYCNISNVNLYKE